MQLRSEDGAFLVQSLGYSLNIPLCVALGISLLDLILSFWSSDPERQSVRCVCSKVTFLCGMVSFSTGLTGWIDRSRTSVFLILCNVCIGIVGILLLELGFV